MVDRATGEAALRNAWRSFAHRLAVVGGCFVALLSLFHHVPASTAALRGGVAWLAVQALARVGAVALRMAYRFDSPDTAKGTRGAGSMKDTRNNGAAE